LLSKKEEEKKGKGERPSKERGDGSEALDKRGRRGGEEPPEGEEHATKKARGPQRTGGMKPGKPALLRKGGAS